MIVTKIEPCTKTKFKIYIDETFKFVLYKGEVSRFGIPNIDRLTANDKDFSLRSK